MNVTHFALDAYNKALFDSIAADALAAESDDEFFKKLWRGIKKVAKKVAPIAKKVAPFTGRIIGGALGGPAGAIQAVDQTPPYVPLHVQAEWLGNHLVEIGASEDLVLETFAELAARDPRAVPIVAAIAARTILNEEATTLPRSRRLHVVKDIMLMAKALVAKRGPSAMRTLPKIVKSVK